MEQRVPDNFMGFFRSLETIPFPEDTFMEHIPGLVAVWDSLGKTQSVSWPWVMMQELALTGFVTPTAVSNLVNSIDVLLPVVDVFAASGRNTVFRVVDEVVCRRVGRDRHQTQERVARQA